MSTETLNLEKGQKIDLTKSNPGLKHVNVGLGWDMKEGEDADLDSFALFLTGGKLVDNKHVVFFGNLHPAGLGVQHMGDNLTGAGEGDDETIKLDLAGIPADVDQIILGVNIYKADERHHQNFGLVENAFVRLYDADTNTELGKYDLSEDYSANTGVVVGKMYRKDGEWKFQAIGEGKNGSIDAIASPYRS